MVISEKLKSLQTFEDLSLLTLRLLIGSFLVWGVSDNLMSSDDMAEFVRFLDANGFPYPPLMAWTSVIAQCVCGVLLIVGGLTRWAGLVMTFNFLVALFMVHLGDDFRGMFPVLCLIFLSLHFAVRGAGRYSVDAIRTAR